MDQKPDRNLAMELARVTEAAALAAGRWMGRGDKVSADQAAVDAMRLVLNTVRMDGIIVIGEGEKDEAPMLYNGEVLGTGEPPRVDIAVDPIDGTNIVALGRSTSQPMLFKPSHSTLRRRWYMLLIWPTHSWGPSRAAMAATWIGVKVP